MTKRLDTVELQLMKKEEQNKLLQRTVEQKNEQIKSLQQHNHELENQLSTQSSLATTLAVDDQIINLKAIHKSEMREKVEQIQELQSELDLLKKGLDEKELYMQLASLKAELKQKNNKIATQEEQIQQLSNLVELTKNHH